MPVHGKRPLAINGVNRTTSLVISLLEDLHPNLNIIALRFPRFPYLGYNSLGFLVFVVTVVCRQLVWLVNCLICCFEIGIVLLVAYIALGVSTVVQGDQKVLLTKILKFY